MLPKIICSMVRKSIVLKQGSLLQNVSLAIMQVNSMDEEMCHVDSCTTNNIFREIKYFQTPTKMMENILAIAGRDACIVGSEKNYYNISHGYTSNN
jgi:hypothetical protein